MKLVALDPRGDLDRLAAELMPGFGGVEGDARAVLEQTFHLLTVDPRPDPWGAYLAYEGQAAVGTCAFKAPPDERGAVEIAYMTFPAYERQGHATAMAGALCGIARRGGAALIVAHTLPAENASTRALRRNGFAFAGDVVDPEDGPVWRWERRCSD